MILAAADFSDLGLVLFGLAIGKITDIVVWVYHKLRGKPKLSLTYSDAGCQTFDRFSREADHADQPIVMTWHELYVRLSIQNINPEIARNCRIYLTNVERYDETGKSFVSTIYRDSIPLIWSFEPQTESVDLPQGIVRHCDVLIVSSPSGEFSMQLRSANGTLLTPLAYEPLFDNPADKLRFTFVAAGHDVAPVRLQLVKEPGPSWQPIISIP